MVDEPRRQLAGPMLLMVALTLALRSCVGCGSGAAGHEAGDGSPGPWEVEPALSRANLGQVVVAPDGMSLAAVVRHLGDRPDELWWVAQDGGHPPKLVGTDRIVQGISWSRDSRLLAYVTWGNAPAGGHVEEVCLYWPGERRGNPVVSGDSLRTVDTSVAPDGRRVALSQFRRAGMRAGHAGGTVVVLETATGRQVWSGQTDRGAVRMDVGWSASADRIYFPLWSEDGRNQIASVQFGIGGEPRLQETRVRSEAWIVRPAPDGSMLAYLHPLSQDNPSALAFSILNVGSGVERVVSRVEYKSFSWSPDGKAFVFLTPEHDLWVMEMDTGKRTRITRDVLCLTEGDPWTTAGWIAFQRSDSTVWRIRPDGGDERLLLDMDAFLRATDTETATPMGTPR